jgi:hypothetical protein
VSGSATFTCPPPVPDNDLCVDATEVECGESYEGNTDAATSVDGQEYCGTFAPSASNGGVWFSFTSEAGEELTLDLSGSDFDTKLFVYSGECDTLTCVTGDDDGGESTTSLVELTAEAGVTYYAYVTGFSSSSGAYSLSVTCGVDCPDLGLDIGDACDDGDDTTSGDVVTEDCECVGTPAPENDNCVDATSIAVGDSIVGDNTAATADGPAMDCAFFGDAVQNDVWFSFVAPENGNLTIETYEVDGSDFNDTQIQVLASCDADTALACDEDGGPSLLSTIELACGEYEAGLTYFIQVDGYSGDDGEFGIIITADDSICDPVEPGECADYRYYLADHSFPEDISDLYEVNISGGAASLEYIATVDVEVHIAYNEAEQMIYAVAKDNGDIYTLDPNEANPSYSGPTSVDDNLTEITQAVFSQDGKLLVSSADQDVTYSIDVMNGNAVTIYDSYSPIEGGDLTYALDGSALFMASREGNGNLYSVFPDDVMDDVLITDIDEVVTGLSTMESGNLLLSAKDNTSLMVKDTDGNDVTSLPLTLDGETYTLRDGDMTAGCNDDPNQGDQDCDPVGECYAQSVVEYVEGTTMNGGAIAPGRDDASNALGEPQRSDELNFVSLGYGGSITLAFDGAVPNEEGDDIEVVETTYNNALCEDYNERADVFVSQDGINFFFARTVCRLDNFVDISDADPELECINFVRIVNNGDLTDSPDGFDVDGVLALHNCEDIDNDDEDQEDGEGLVAELTSYPNPTSGPSQVVFTTAQTARTMVEVYDMNGRNVATLYNQVANQGQEYRLDFNGSDLPNGVYIYRLTTENESIIEKFMIAR